MRRSLHDEADINSEFFAQRNEQQKRGQKEPENRIALAHGLDQADASAQSREFQAEHVADADQKNEPNPEVHRCDLSSQ